MKKTSPLHYLGLLFVLAVFALAAWLLVHQVREYNHKFPDQRLTFARIGEDLMEIRWTWMLAAVGLTVFNYGILACYDYLAFRYAEIPISPARVSFAALVGYSFSYNFGATVAGLPMRYRLYAAWNIPLAKIVQLLVILAFTFWFGVFTLAGVLFVFTPLRIPPPELRSILTDLHDKLGDRAAHAFGLFFADSRWLGLILLTLAAVYVGTSLLHRGSLKIFRWTLPVPPPRLTICQIGIASADMLVAGAVFYLLCPPLIHGHGYWTVLEVYMVAYVLNILSHVPGGWGVIEATITLLLGKLHYVSEANMPRVFAAIVVFRVIYFLLPLLVAVSLVAWHEYALRKNWIRPLVPHDDAPAASEKNVPSVNGQPQMPGTKASEKKHEA
jgi:uncharacterized membrane protein YbhN (UPF0104 family)